jgi:plastin-1
VAPDERAAFAAHLNAHVSDARRLPLDAAGADLFHKLRDGVLLCKLVNCAAPGTIDERVITDKESLSRFHMTENAQLALASARGVGCRLVNIGCDDVLDAKPNLLLGLLWQARLCASICRCASADVAHALPQLVRLQLLSAVHVARVPELVALLAPGEALPALLSLPAESLLLRWVNYHLARAGVALRIANFGADVADGAAYCALLQQLEPTADCDAARLPPGAPRAACVLRCADRLLQRSSGARYVCAGDILASNAKLNLAFAAALFAARHGLPPLAADAAAPAAALLDFSESSGDGREERVLRFWANSLGLDAPCERLLVAVADGRFLLLLLERLARGSVDWRRVAQPPFKLRFQRLENLNLAVELARGPPFNAVLVGIDGTDLLEKRAKFVLALCWQLMRYDLLSLLRGLSSGEALPSDAEIIRRANEKVAAAGKAARMSSFRDASLADGTFFLHLLDACGASVDWALVSSEGSVSEAAREANAKYVISLARKRGASLFLLWVRKRMRKQCLVCFARR